MNKSFLKWAGGKSQLVPKILSLMPLDASGRFFDVFVGSGVVALNVPHKRIVINDVNEGLMSLWWELQKEPGAIRHCEHFFNPTTNSEEQYYRIRKLFNDKSEVHSFMRGAMFLYLNKHGFNGLCRFNKSGEFNVPYNHRKTCPGFPLEELENAVKWFKTKRVTIFNQDFRKIMRRAGKNDVVYCDPPYVPRNKTSAFTTYSKDGFRMDEQMALMLEAEKARSRGVTVIISNNDVSITRKLYDGADEIHEVSVRKSISCKGNGREKQGELIAVYRP